VTQRTGDAARGAPAERSVAHADNLAFMAALPDGCCTLIYADPPFCSGRDRRAATHAQTFDDRWARGIEEYLEFLLPRLIEFRRLLSQRGTLYVHLDWRAVHHVRVRLDEIFGPENFLNEVVWSYRTGGVSRKWFARKHDTLLVYARRLGSHVFNQLRDGAYRTDGLRFDDAGRPFKSTRAGRLYFDARGPALTDVWDVPFLSTVSLERCGYPSQKPLALLERVVCASSNPGDLVADFFCGSGTTLVAAERLGRSWMGCDANPAAVTLARKRIDQLRGVDHSTAVASKTGPSVQQSR
jgi:DNA modification methylase